MKFLNFKCLSLPTNKNLGKIYYLNSQTNPWKEVKMENCMVHHEKKFFSPPPPLEESIATPEDLSIFRARVRSWVFRPLNDSKQSTS
jgi:hypothetical protein